MVVLWLRSEIKQVHVATSCSGGDRGFFQFDMNSRHKFGLRLVGALNVVLDTDAAPLSYFGYSTM